MADATNLPDLIQTIAKQHKYDPNKFKIEPVQSDGRNYLTNVYLITLSAEGKDDLELFAKVAATSEVIRLALNASLLYETEAFVYTKLADVFRELQADIREGDKFVFPKFYGCKQKLYEETIVLENLVADGFEAHDRFKSVDWKHASSAITTLARFHALSFAYEQKYPEEYGRITDKYTFVHKDASESTSKVWELMMKRTMLAVKEEHRGSIMSFLQKKQEEDVKFYETYNRPFGRAILAHGDYRTCNMLFKTEGDGVHTMPVDYQTVRSGSPTNDLVYFIATATDSQFRERHYDQLTEVYYANLALRMGELGVDASEVYPKDTFYSELEKMLPYALLVGITVLPMVLVEESQVPRMNGDSDLASFVVASSAEYTERMAGLVEDLVKWGAI